MKCPKCQTELAETSTQCNTCGYRFRSDDHSQRSSDSSTLSNEKEITRDGDSENMLKPLSGFRRTLSTELVERQTELRTLMKLNTLIQRQTYEPGEILIQKGDAKRDLFFLTEGRVEISTKRADGNLKLNEIEPPYILGEIAFLSGLHRTATVKAITKLETFVLKYDDLKNIVKGIPEWVNPFLSSFASGIKSLQFKIEELEGEIAELKGNSKGDPEL